MTRLLADDSSLFYARANIADIAGIINHDLQMMSNWAKQWLVTFNSLKTEAVLFTLKKLDFFTTSFFDNVVINFVDSHKYLGVKLSSNGQWYTHIENIVSSAARSLEIMRKLKYSISRNALNQMNKSNMLPVIEYASIVWDGCLKQDSQTLRKIQNEAAWLVARLTRSVSLKNLYIECGWATLSQRRHQHKLSFMYAVNTGMVPSYIQAFIPPLVSEISDNPLRNNSNISVTLNRMSLSILQKYCIPLSIRLWNSLEDNFKNISTLPTFRKHIISTLNIANVPPFFSMGNIYMFVLRAKLRNNCSGINSDLFRNHISNNSVCDLCNVSEDAYHFFFQCRKYSVERHFFNDTVIGVHSLNINVILYLNGN